MNAAQLVDFLLEAVIVPKGVAHLVRKIEAIAARSAGVGSFVAAANRFLRPHRIAYDKNLPYDGFYDRKSRWIFLRYPESVDAAADLFERWISHEMVHREQFARAGSRVPKVKPMSKTKSAEYMLRPHEQMAYAFDWVGGEKKAGLSKEQIKQKMRTGSFDPRAPADMFAFYYSKARTDPRFTKITGATPKEQKKAKRFFKNAYSYLEK